MPGDPAVKTVLPPQGVQVPSLVRELKSCWLHSVTRKTEKRNQDFYANIYLLIGLEAFLPKFI